MPAPFDRGLAAVLAIALVLPAGAQAGAWPRPKGETFLSFGQELSTGATTLIGAVTDIRSWSSVYAEYGLTDRLTIGLDAGLAWGRGIAEGRHGGGWLGMESSAELREPAGEVALKADFTAGWKPNERWMVIGQVQTGYYPVDGGIVRLAPSVVRRISPHSHLQLGATAEVVGEGALGLTGAVWFSF